MFMQSEVIQFKDAMKKLQVEISNKAEEEGIVKPPHPEKQTTKTAIVEPVFEVQHDGSDEDSEYDSESVAGTNVH